MNEIKIRDLYVGKPDAKDEVNFQGFDDFVKAYVVADHFNIDSLTSGSNCFITGFKGTGKTALLLYLDDVLRKADNSTCSSFIFFKEDYTDVKRDELEGLSRRILSSVSIDQSTLLETNEFEFIWRWLLLKRIVADNEEYNRNLFVDDDNWKMFERIVGTILAPKNKRKISIPKSIKMRFPVSTVEPTIGITATPEFEVDLQKQSDDNYKNFIHVIEQAESLFSKLKRTDIPYYIFVDELEAYYGELTVFKRDLCLIRDLLFAVKYFNTIFITNQLNKTKIICSVRSEILTAISRFVITKELNKITSGFSVPLSWNYSTTSSYLHPIMQIFLKRIGICENKESTNYDYKDIYDRWLPEKIQSIEPANYILNNSWYKPRDIVRLLSVSQNCIFNNNKAFTQAVFNSIVKAYSEDSLSEIKEELRALYSPNEIDIIINCFMGYKTIFSISELKNRVDTLFSATVLKEKFLDVINDLYRLGFLGNYLPLSKTYRWQHRGDDRVILSNEWRLTIHYALRSALSIGSRQDYGLNRGQAPQKGDLSVAIVKKVFEKYALVEFEHYGGKYQGCIYIGYFSHFLNKRFIDLRGEILKGQTYNVVVLKFNEKFQEWILEIADK